MRLSNYATWMHGNRVHKGQNRCDKLELKLLQESRTFRELVNDKGTTDDVNAEVKLFPSRRQVTKPKLRQVCPSIDRARYSSQASTLPVHRRKTCRITHGLESSSLLINLCTRSTCEIVSFYVQD